MKKLSLIFLDGEGKKVTLKPTYAKENASTEEVKEVMSTISALHLFEKEGTVRYATPSSAHYTETVITTIF